MEPTTKTKSDLRKEFLIKRNQLDPGERTKNSSLIRQRIFQHPKWRSSSTLLCYVSFGSEVETHLLIQEALRFKKRVIVPLHDASKETPISELHRFTELGTVHRGILQVLPEFRRPAEPSDVELVLVPGILFCRQGGRIGFGGGYFDRLLPKMPKAFRLGLAFSMQVSQALLPLENFDVKMQAIATEKETIDTTKTLR